jgi:hypothetical protein
MGTNLSVDELKAALGFGDLLAEVDGELGEQIAVFKRCGLGFKMQLCDLASKQSMSLSFEVGNIALRVLNLTRDTEKLSRGSFTGERSIDLTVIVEQALQSFGIAAAVSLIGAGHQQGEVFLLSVIARKVGVDALSDLAEECLEAGGRVELFGFSGSAECGVMGRLCLATRFFGSAPRGVGVVKIDLALANPRFNIVQFSVKHAHLTKVTTLESFELSAELGKLRFALGQPCANAGKLLAFVEEGNLVRALLEDNFG